MKKVIFSLFLCIIFSLSLFAQETITLTTYYPAPFGVYQQIITQTIGVGDNSRSGNIDTADAPDPTTNPGDVWISGKVGIGTVDLAEKLEIQDGGLQFSVRKSGNKVDLGRITAYTPGQSGWTGKQFVITTTTFDSDGNYSFGGEDDGIWIGNDIRGESAGGAGRGFVRLDAANIVMTRGKVGINTMSPQTKLDVVGEIKLSKSGLECSADTEGAMRYDSATGVKKIEYCNGIAWTSFASSMTYAAAKALGLPDPSIWPDSVMCQAGSTRRIFHLHGLLNSDATDPNDRTVIYRTMADSCKMYFRSGSGSYKDGSCAGSCSAVSIKNQQHKMFNSGVRYNDF